MRPLSLLALLALAACQSPFNGANDALSVAERHPINVDTRMISENIAVGPETFTLTAAEREAARRLLEDFRVRGVGKLSIASPTSSPNAAAVVQVTAELTNIAKDVGVPVGALDIAGYRSSGAEQRAPIVVSYMVYQATPSACGQWDTNLSFSPLNKVSPNFGCATQNNIAALVENPRDLVEPETMTGADQARRAVTLKKYREGEVTAAKTMDDESAAVSEVNK